MDKSHHWSPLGIVAEIGFILHLHLWLGEGNMQFADDTKVFLVKSKAYGGEFHKGLTKSSKINSGRKALV